MGGNNFFLSADTSCDYWYFFLINILYIDVNLFKEFYVTDRLYFLFSGDNAFEDEFEHFECITTQPGCKQMCFTMFSPMSHVRFWSLQEGIKLRT